MCLTPEVVREMTSIHLKLLLLQAQLDSSAKVLGVQLPTVKVQQPK